MSSLGASGFLQRHLWSLSLSLVSALCFAQLASELGGGELTPFDSAVGGAVAQWRGSADALMLGLTRFGNPAPVFTLTIVVVGLLVACPRRREASYLALCATCTLLLNVAMKALFHRARPGPGGLSAAHADLVLVSERPRHVLSRCVRKSGRRRPDARLAATVGVLGGRGVRSDPGRCRPVSDLFRCALCFGRDRRPAGQHRERERTHRLVLSAPLARRVHGSKRACEVTRVGR